MPYKNIIEKVKEYHFEFKHLTMLFIILFSFQIVISIINKSAIKTFLNNTQEWYQKDSAERLANLTTTSLELLLETINPKDNLSEEDINRMIQSFNIIFSQQIMQHNVEELCIIVNKNDEVYAIDDGKVLFNYLFYDSFIPPQDSIEHNNAKKLYLQKHYELKKTEQILKKQYANT